MSKTVKTVVTTEIVDLTGGLGNLSIDEVLARTGGKAGEIVEIQPDGSKVTYFVEEVRFAELKANVPSFFTEQQTKYDKYDGL